MHTVVFVGGPRDGVKLTVDELRPIFKVDVYRATKPIRLGDPLLERENFNIEVMTYYLTEIIGQHEKFRFYLDRSMRLDEGLARLLEHYHPPEKKDGK